MKSNTLTTIKYYWKEVWNYKWIGLVIASTSIIASIVDVFIPVHIKNFFNTLTFSGNGIDSTTYDLLISTLVVIAGLSFAHWVISRINYFSVVFFESKIKANLSNKCFAYLHKNSFSFFSKSFVGTLVKRINWFNRAFESIVDEFIARVLPLIVSLSLISVILIKTYLWLGLGVLLWAFLFLFITWIFSKYKLKYDIERNRIESDVTGLLADSITNNANVKLFNGYQREVSNFEESNKKLDKIRRFSWNLGGVFDAVQGLFALVLQIGTLFVAVHLWKRGLLTVGDFAMIQMYVFSIVDKVWSFNRVLRRIYESLSDAEEMITILETPHEIVDVPNAKELKIKKGEIEFSKVIFNYNKTRNVVDNLDLAIPSRQRIAIVGSSGVGKTTIIKLLFRMHDLTSGKILIDGQDISKVTQESLWKAIGLVPQDPILFHRSLMENMRYGNPNATDKEVIAASKLANCHNFITKLEFGYDTFVGERGTRLSGGERQRVAIARAILKNAPILILDEATSNLDSESEQLIQESLSKLMKNKTVVVIAHRLSTIKQMDRIIVMDKGKIIEDGNHNELIEKKEGIYRKLWQLQAGDFVLSSQN